MFRKICADYLQRFCSSVRHCDGTGIKPRRGVEDETFRELKNSPKFAKFARISG